MFHSAAANRSIVIRGCVHQTMSYRTTNRSNWNVSADNMLIAEHLIQLIRLSLGNPTQPVSGEPPDDGTVSDLPRPTAVLPASDSATSTISAVKLSVTLNVSAGSCSLTSSSPTPILQGNWNSNAKTDFCSLRRSRSTRSDAPPWIDHAALEHNEKRNYATAEKSPKAEERKSSSSKDISHDRPSTSGFSPLQRIEPSDRMKAHRAKDQGQAETEHSTSSQICLWTLFCLCTRFQFSWSLVQNFREKDTAAGAAVVGNRGTSYNKEPKSALCASNNQVRMQLQRRLRVRNRATGSVVTQRPDTADLQ